MNHELNSHNQHRRHEERETDTLLPLELEALAARLAADGAVWQSHLPDAGRVAERIRAIPHESLLSASDGDLPRFADTTTVPESSRTVHRPAGRQGASSSRWGRFLGLAAAAVVVALLATVLVQLANQRGRTTSPAASPVPSQTQPTSTAVPATASPTHPAGAVVRAPIDTIAMFSATTGWGTVQAASNPNIVGGIAYTVDGGHTWYEATPSGLTLKPGGTIALYPVSITEAWTWFSPPAGSGSTTLWHTTDAGTHWSTTSVATGAVLHLDFSDSLHGWLDADPSGAAAGLFPINVWRTTDGGATWAQVGSYRVFAGTTGMSFANATTGFARSTGGSLYVTHDAGSSWFSLSLPTVPGYVVVAAELPVFTSATAGVLEVGSGLAGEGSSSPTLLTVYRTTDAGTSWQLGASLSGAPGRNTSTNIFPSSVLATGGVFAAVTVSGQVALYQLPVGATGWVKVTTQSSSAGLLSGITQLNMASQTTGWAVTSSGLIGTTDGGVTWTVLHA